MRPSAKKNESAWVGSRLAQMRLLAFLLGSRLGEVLLLNLIQRCSRRICDKCAPRKEKRLPQWWGRASERCSYYGVTFGANAPTMPAHCSSWASGCGEVAALRITPRRGNCSQPRAECWSAAEARHPGYAAHIYYTAPCKGNCIPFSIVMQLPLQGACRVSYVCPRAMPWARSN